LVEGISRLEQGHVLESDGLEFKVTEEWCLQPSARSVSFSQAVKDSNELLVAALSNTAGWGGSRVCPLSGGDDSRRIMAAVEKSGLDPAFISQRYIGPGGYDEDTIPAKMLAEVLQKDLSVCDVCSEQEIGQDSLNAWCQTNGESLSHGWMQKMLRAVSPGSLVYDGLGGGELMNGHFVKLYPECSDRYQDTEYLVDVLMGKLQLSLAVGLRRDLKDYLFSYVSALPETPYRITLFHLYNHTRRNTGGMAVIYRETGITPFTPFVTKAVLEQALSLNYKEHFDRSFQDMCTRALNYKLSDVPRTRLGFSSEYKVDLRHTVDKIEKYKAAVGKINYALNFNLLSARDSFLTLAYEITGKGNKNIWRSVPLRKLGFMQERLNCNCAVEFSLKEYNV